MLRGSRRFELCVAVFIGFFAGIKRGRLLGAPIVRGGRLRVVGLCCVNWLSWNTQSLRGRVFRSVRRRCNLPNGGFLRGLGAMLNFAALPAALGCRLLASSLRGRRSYSMRVGRRR